jgi:hypothetical protein
VPTQRHAGLLHGGARIVFLRVNVAFRDTHVAVPGQVSATAVLCNERKKKDLIFVALSDMSDIRPISQPNESERAHRRSLNRLGLLIARTTHSVLSADKWCTT